LKEALAEAESAEAEERQYRIDDAKYQMEEGEKVYRDYVDELELYKLIAATLKQMDDDESKRSLEEAETEIRRIQMDIGQMENMYEQVKNTYDGLIAEGEFIA
jgi:hypothetical protein